jgi:very-short-patch-repair endonuclease
MCYEYTSLEKIVADELDKRNVEYICQYPTTSGFVLDFVLSPDIVLEADGPCHDSSKARKRDWFRDKCLKLEGWKVHRLGYELINDPERLSARITEILLK